MVMPPTNVLSRNVGNGNLEVQWDRPTNYILYSENFDNVVWGNLFATVTPNVIANPLNGALTASLLTEQANNHRHEIYQLGLTPPLGSNTFSVYAKMNGRRYLDIAVYDLNELGMVKFDLQTGSVAVTSLGSGVIENIGGGWFKCSVTFTYGGNGAVQVQLSLNSSNVNFFNSYLGDGVSGIYIFAAHYGSGHYVKTLAIPITTLALAGIDHFDIYISTEQFGTYVKANKRPIQYWKGVISNLKFNSIIYVKVKEIGLDGSVSDFSAVALDGECERATMSLTFNGPVGDSIPMGAMFSQMVGDGHVVAFRTTASGTIS